ncbi:MAG: DNA repair protein RecN [Rickettsiales bacterium]|jgi:DNA repair protein RecN (Recombination protein N)|nr:DNA repair protein RecN [Rickettsiales bacterium]
MLTRLYISNIVLIDKLELEFRGGLSVMTGETGAGKSILLDALSLALGAKADPDLIRAGAAEATVVADFDGTLLKRVVTVDGKSKCWVNDEPATQKTLKEIGDELVEIHGQFSNHGLLDDKTHVHYLDAFGGYEDLLDGARRTYAELRDAEKKLKDLRELLEKSAAEREFLEHSVRELEALNPEAGEEQALDDARRRMMDMEKNAGTLRDALAMLGQGDLAEKIFSAAHILERTKSYRQQIDRLYEAGSAIQEVAEQIAPRDGFDAADLEAAEERLFALRAAARKHRVSVAELPEQMKKMRAQLNAIDDSDGAVKKLEDDVKNKKSGYEKFASALTRERIAAAAELAELVKNELPELKLGGADFRAEVAAAGPGAHGSDSVRFMIRTNPGTPFAPLDKIASGGELARFMLALRVILMHGSRTLIFDELDTGISGATAAAVGLRLAKLARAQQIVAITHSAQVAGFGDAHFLITKNTDGKTTRTSVREIGGADRVNEIARIISGAKITSDAIKTAKTLLRH